MKTKTHGMRVISLLAIGAMFWVITPLTPACAGYASGTRAVGCDDFWLDGKPTFDSGKALSADLFEYNFSTKMRLGFDISAEDNYCKARYCTAKVVGNWNSKTGQASERFSITCTYEKGITNDPYPPFLSLTTLVTCPKDPWINSEGMLKHSVSCSAPSFTGVAPFSPMMPIYPLTAYSIGYEGRDRIAALSIGRGSSDFVVPPALPPEIIVDGMAGSDSMSFSRGQSAKIAIVRPPDGNPKWYNKPWKYDVEIQVKRAAKIGHHVDSWVILPGSISAVEGAVPKTNLTLPYSSLFNDDKSDWNIETVGVGKYRTIQIRARVQPSGAWSGWRRFWVEPPLTMAPEAGKAPAATGAAGAGAQQIKPSAAPKPLNTPATQQQINKMQQR